MFFSTSEHDVKLRTGAGGSAINYVGLAYIQFASQFRSDSDSGNI